MTKPTKEEIETAKRVLEYFQPMADLVSDKTEQSDPTDWCVGAAVWIELLGMEDPEEHMQGYLDAFIANET